MEHDGFRDEAAMNDPGEGRSAGVWPWLGDGSGRRLPVRAPRARTRRPQAGGAREAGGWS